MATLIKQFNLKNVVKFFGATKDEPIGQVIKNVFTFFRLELYKIQIKKHSIAYKIEELFLISENELNLIGWIVSKNPIKKLVVKISDNNVFVIKPNLRRLDILEQFQEIEDQKNQGFKLKIPVTEIDIEYLKKTQKVIFEITDFENRNYKFIKLLQKPQIDSIKISEILNLLKEQKRKPIEITETIDVIIPIYNGYNLLVPLFDTLQNNTITNFRLIIVDDASTDSNVISIIKSLTKRFKKVLIIRNEKNIGFVKSVNKGVKHTNYHFVILNSDVEVPVNWLAKIMQPIIENEKIASVTPFTNAGTICSFPIINEDNEAFDSNNLNTVNEVFYSNANAVLQKIPTGVGFCMAINKKAVDRIGFFDEQIFGRGFAEENDWCRRAAKVGFTNFLTTNLYVKHEHGGTFEKKEKAKLIKQNLEKLHTKHPEYAKLVWEHSKQDSLKNFREAILFKVMNKLSESTILVLDHNNGGGAVVYRNQKIDKWKSENKLIVKVFYKKTYQTISIIVTYKKFEQAIEMESFDLFKQLLQTTKLKTVFVNELVGFPNIKQWIDFVLDLKNTIDCKLIFPIHDFHSVCPSYTLLNNEEKFCNIPNNLKVCDNCIIKIKHTDLESTDIKDWRKMWQGFLKNCDQVICFSNSSKNLIFKAYPFLESLNIVSVIPHQLKLVSKPVKNKLQGKFKIGVLGAINLQKGSNKIVEFSKWIVANKKNAAIIVVGVLHYNNKLVAPNKYKNLKITGRYLNEDLTKIIESNNINVFFIPSIWPETFSYTTAEIMEMKMPLGVYNIGAQAERVSNYNLGKVFEMEESFENIYKQMEQLFLNEELKIN